MLAASIFHFGEFSIREAKLYMAKSGLRMRLDANRINRRASFAETTPGKSLMNPFSLDDLAAIIAARAGAATAVSYTKRC